MEQTIEKFNPEDFSFNNKITTGMIITAEIVYLYKGEQCGYSGRNKEYVLSTPPEFSRASYPNVQEIVGAALVKLLEVPENIEDAFNATNLTNMFTQAYKLSPRAAAEAGDLKVQVTRLFFENAIPLLELSRKA